MTKIIRYENSCQISEEDDVEIFRKLDYHLSYEIPGAEYSKAFKGYFNDHGEFVAWDGRRHIMSSAGRFPPGLFTRVLEFYEKMGVSPTIIDGREERLPGTPIDVFPKLIELKKKPRTYQEEAAEAACAHDRGIIRIATGGGKCESIDSLHVTEHGLLDYKEMLEEKLIDPGTAVKYETMVGTSDKFGTVEKTSMIYHDGYSESIKITTSYGYTQTGTSNHRIQVMDRSGNVIWARLGDIKNGDYAAICYGSMMFGREEMSLDDAYWYGLLFGDGSLTLNHTVSFTNMDDHLLKFAREYLRNNGQEFSEYKKGKVTDIKVYSKEYRDFLLKIGFGYEKSIYKQVPVSIRKLTRKPQSMFLRGVFETDGWIGSEKSKPTVNLGLSNKKAIDQIHLMLLNFGIVCSRRVKKTTHEDSHILTIYRGCIDTFVSEIGFDPNGRKYAKLEEHMKCCGKENPNSFIPHQRYRLRSIVKSIPKEAFDRCPIKKNTVRSWIGSSAWRNPTKKNLTIFLAWAISLGIDTASDLLFDIKNVFFDTISSTEIVQSDNYDFVVPNTHSFISQGFVNHNTLVAALIAAKLGKPTIIYVIGQDLLYQFHDFFTKVFGTEIGIIGDGKCEIKDINIATIWSVGQALGLKKNASLDDEGSTEKKTDPAKFSTIKRMLLNTSVHIMDECHLAACDTVQIISRNIKAEYVYGMSASPWRDDNADLLIEAFLGQKIVDLSAKKLIEQGFLVEPDIRFLAPPLYKKKSKYQTLYQTYVVENEIRNGMIAKGAVKLIEQGFPTLVLFHSIKHGDILNSIIAPQVPTGLLSGKDGKKERERIKDGLESGKIKCIIASKIFDIGIDLPILSGLIVAGAGKSSVRALQRIGRVIRPYEGKSRAAIIDFADQARYLDEHAEKRRDIYSQEFNKIKWPHEKSKKES